VKLFAPADSPWRVAPGDARKGGFKVKHARTVPPADAPDKETCQALLAHCVEQLAVLQKALYANDHRSVLLVFQAMDAAGKDSTIRAVMSGIDPSGCQVKSFKQPSVQELEHDFLWRATLALPERGRIGIFNRSYYEEVLAVKVHPELLDNQHLPQRPKHMDDFWAARYESIRDYEKHLARNGTVILKFWLNVSKNEQRKRFLERLEEPEKNWKFSSSDIAERKHWKAYMRAYQDLIRETSRDYAPWYAVPADDKPYMRLAVAEIVLDTLKALDPQYPVLEPAEKKRFAAMKRALNAEG
jgi:PPK2 family polyphosphate:nucleotide phosphotransferase